MKFQELGRTYLKVSVDADFERLYEAAGETEREEIGMIVLVKTFVRPVSNLAAKGGDERLKSACFLQRGNYLLK